MIRQSRFWLRTLNVRKEEGWLVKQLFLLQFLQGAGIAFFFTASFALFLDRFEITELAYIFVYAAFLLWLMGFLYSRAERLLSSINLAIAVTVFMGTSILAFRLAWHYFDSAFFFYFMLAWFNVLYLINNLEFWGLASLLFNARQSKRLFSVISAGDIPAKFFGYSLALLIVEKIGTVNLLLLGFACMMLSIPFLLRLKRSGSIPAFHHHEKQSVPQGGIRKLVHNLTGNSLTRSLAVLSIVVTCSFLIINFAFYAGVKSAYHNEVTLAKFIAFFLAMVRIIALAIKMIFTSRLINRFGNINSLLVTPIVMTIMVLAIVGTQDMAAFPKMILYLFGVTSIVVDILRSSINSPVFLTLMQPLPAHDRLRAHTIVKGIMDPFASLFTGLILIGVIEFHGHVSLLTLCYVLVGLAVLWFAAIYLVNRNYITTILKTISSRFFNNTYVAFDDRNTLVYLREKVKSGTETEAMNILEMISKSNKENQVEICTLALDHPSEKVRSLALDTIAMHKLDVPQHSILKYLKDPSEMVCVSALKALNKGTCEDLVLPMLSSESDKIKSAAIAALVNSSSSNCAEQARRELDSLLISPMPHHRAMAASILPEVDEDTHRALIRKLMADESGMVREAAFDAAAEISDPRLVESMMEHYPSFEKEITPALLKIGEPALSPIRKFITSVNTNAFQIEKLLLVCGRIGGSKAKTILLTLLASHPRHSTAILKALYRTGYSAPGNHPAILTEQVKRLLDKCETVIRMQSLLELETGKYELLANAFSIEINQAREELLYLFSMLYNRDNINTVRHAYISEKRERIINAMEIIDLTVKKDFARRFNNIFEPGNLHDKLQALPKAQPGAMFTVTLVFETVLADMKGLYNNWTKACCLYLSASLSDAIDPALIKKHVHAESGLLRETAIRTEALAGNEPISKQEIYKTL